MSSPNIITIGIELETIELLQKVLHDNSIEKICKILKECFVVNINIVDYTAEFEYASKFLLENNMEDENPFFRVFDINKYSRQIEFQLLKNEDVEYIEAILLMLARKVSRLLGTKCILVVNNLSMPIVLFDNGRVVNNFEEYNRGFFINKAWQVKIDDGK